MAGGAGREACLLFDEADRVILTHDEHALVVVLGERGARRRRHDHVVRRELQVEEIAQARDQVGRAVSAIREEHEGHFVAPQVLARRNLVRRLAAWKGSKAGDYLDGVFGPGEGLAARQHDAVDVDENAGVQLVRAHIWRGHFLNFLVFLNFC